MFRIQYSNIKNKQLFRYLRLLKWIWIAFLTWVVIGGVIGEILQWTEFVEPYCDENVNDPIYPTCTPCQMHIETFGVFNVNNCPNALLKNTLDYAIALPRFFVAVLSLFVYVLVDLLYQVSRYLPAIILIPAVSIVLLRTLFTNFIQRKDIERGLHRGLLAGWLILATLLAVQW